MNDDKTRFRIDEDPFLHTLFMEMPCACMFHELVYDEGGNAIDYIPIAANLSFARVIGKDPAPIIGKRASEYLPERAMKHWLAIFASAAQQGKTVYYHMYAPLMNQTYFGTAISAEPNTFLSMFTVVSNSAVPAMESNAGTHIANEALSPSAFTKKIFETMPCAGMICRIDLDADGKPADYTATDVNNAYCELMGVDRTEVVNIRASARLDAQTARHWLNTFAPVALGGRFIRETTCLLRKKCLCVGIAIRTEPGMAMVVFNYLDSYGYFIKRTGRADGQP